MLAATLFAASVILTIFLTKRRRRLEVQRQTNTLQYYLIDNALLAFFQPLAIVLAFYHALLLVTIWSADHLTTGTLLRIEHLFLSIKTGLGWFKDPLNVLRVLELLFFLGIFGVPLLQSKRLFAFASDYRRQMKRLYSIAILLCSFTLLGSELGEPAQTLSVQIAANRTGYGLLQKAVGQALTQATARDLYQKAPDALPPAYGATRKAFEHAGPETRSLISEYQEARERIGIGKIPDAETITQRRLKAEQATAATEQYDTAVNSPTGVEDVPADTSGAKIKKAQESLAKQTDPSILLLSEEGGRAVAVQAPRVITDRLKTVLTDTLVHEYPILGALFSAINGTIDKVIEDRIKARLDEITREIVAQPDPTHIEKLIAENAKQITDVTAIRVPPSLKAQAAQAITTSQREIARVSTTKRRVSTEVQVQINRLINQLQDARESEREHAVQKLAGIGDKLNQKQVQRLESMLRDRRMRWSKAAEREGHCTWYDTTSVAYYAGKSVEQLRSPFVGPPLTSAAREAIENGRGRQRVTDPGWI